MELDVFTTRFENSRRISADVILNLINSKRYELMYIGTNARNRMVLKIKCTEEDYILFKNNVEKMYLGLATFEI